MDVNAVVCDGCNATKPLTISTWEWSKIEILCNAAIAPEVSMGTRKPSPGYDTVKVERDFCRACTASLVIPILTSIANENLAIAEARPPRAKRVKRK